jgi:hypothetical protein
VTLSEKCCSDTDVRRYVLDPLITHGVSTGTSVPRSQVHCAAKTAISSRKVADESFCVFDDCNYENKFWNATNRKSLFSVLFFFNMRRTKFLVLLALRRCTSGIPPCYVRVTARPSHLVKWTCVWCQHGLGRWESTSLCRCFSQVKCMGWAASTQDSAAEL